MNVVILTQVIAQLMLTFVFGGVVFAGIVTRELVWIIASIVAVLLWLLFFFNMIRVIKEELGHKNTSKVNYTYFICLIIVSCFFSAFLYLNIESAKFRSHAKETTAIVYDIDKTIEYETEYDEDGNSYEKEVEKCVTHVEYEVDGEKYRSKLDFVSCNYDIDDKVKVYYDVDNPAIMEEKSNKYFLWFGFILSSIGMAFLIVNGVKEIIRTGKSMKKTLKKKRKNTKKK